MNIFQLASEFQDIVNELEENGGEITPELEEQLDLNQEGVKNKVKSFTQVIAQLESDIDLIKDEQDRLSKLKKNKENAINAVKKLILYSITMFGDTNKSGTKFIDFGIGKVSTRKSVSINIDEESYKGIAEVFRRNINWAGYTNQLDYINQLDSEIKTCLREYQKSESDPITPICATDDDLDVVKMQISLNVPLNQLKDNDTIELLKEIAKVKHNSIEVTPKIDKTILKKLHIGDNDNSFNLSKLVETQNVIIK